MSLVTGNDFCLVVTEDGDLYGFGENNVGQLGLGNVVVQQRPVLINTEAVLDGHKVLMAAAGHTHAACVTRDGSLYMWGCGTRGELGHGPEVLFSNIPLRLTMHNFGHSPALMVACGTEFSMLLTAVGSVWICGDARYPFVHAELGLNPLQWRDHFTMIDPVHFDHTSIGMISSGNSHCMALAKENGTLWTWGLNTHGQCGHGHTDPILLPTVVQAVLAECDSFNFVEAGQDVSMAVTTAGALWVCGCNSSNELGCGVKRRSQTTMMRVQKPLNLRASGVRMVNCGMWHTVVLTKDGGVWACGRGSSCLGTKFGTEDDDDEKVLKQINPAFFNGNKIKLVAGGNNVSLAVDEHGAMYIWGKQRHYTGEYWQPRLMDSADLGHARVGCWHDIPVEHELAICMGRHERLGSDSAVRMFLDELLISIFEQMQFSPREGSGDGFRDLVGRRGV